MSCVIRLMAMLSLIAFTQMTWGQEIYKSVMPDGRIVYSYTPPSGSTILESITPDTTQPNVDSDPVVLYSATWCGYCKQAKSYLDVHGIAYTDIDIDTREGMAALVNAEGGKNVPFLTRGDKHIKGFSTAGYDQFFASR